MKIALCLSGYLSGGVDSFNYIKRELLDKNDMDIFIHTWDIENEDEIKRLYGNWIKDIDVHKQYDFKDEVELLEPIHDYDVGTRHEHGMSQGEHEPNKFLEDYLHDNFVVILETGDSTYRHKRGTDDADSEE